MRGAASLRALPLLLIVALAPQIGCRSLSRQGPVPRSMSSARQLSQQGISAMERDDWERAERLLERAVRTCPIDAEAHCRYADTLAHRGALSDAIAQMEEAARLSTEDAQIAVRTGQLYLATNQLESARHAAEHALDLDPKLAAAWALRAKTFEATGHFRAALSDYQRSLGFAPDNSEVLLLVAEVYRRLNQPERALVTLHTLLDAYSPGEEPQQPLYLEGLAQTALGRYDDAVDNFRLANARGRPTAEILCRLAEAEMLAGRRAAAQATAQQALALEPNHAGSRALLDRMRLAQQEPATRAR